VIEPGHSTCLGFCVLATRKKPEVGHVLIRQRQGRDHATDTSAQCDLRTDLDYFMAEGHHVAGSREGRVAGQLCQTDPKCVLGHRVTVGCSIGDPCTVEKAANTFQSPEYLRS